MRYGFESFIMIFKIGETCFFTDFFYDFCSATKFAFDKLKL
jgi:hypothetical protein